MMTGSGRLYTFPHQLAKVYRGFLPARLPVPGAARAKHLFHRLRQTIGVAEHQAVKLLLLRFRKVASLQGFQMQAYRGDRSFQLVGNGVDEAVVLLAAAKLTHQEAGVHDHARDDQRKKDDAKEQQHSLAPVEDNPSDIKSNRERHQGDAQEKKEDDGSTAARDAHSVTLILPLRRPHPSPRWFRSKNLKHRGHGGAQGRSFQTTWITLCASVTSVFEIYLHAAKNPDRSDRGRISEMHDSLVACRRTLRQTARNQPSIWRGDQSVLQVSQLHTPNVPGQPELLEGPNPVPVHVNLIPGEPVLGRSRMRVVIVVPAFAKRQQRYPPAISRKIACSKSPRSTGMRRRIHQPGSMRSHHCPHEN